MNLACAYPRARQVYGVVALAVAPGLAVLGAAWMRSPQADEVSSAGVLVGWVLVSGVLLALVREVHHRISTRFLLVDGAVVELVLFPREESRFELAELARYDVDAANAWSSVVLHARDGRTLRIPGTLLVHRADFLRALLDALESLRPSVVPSGTRTR